MVLALNDRNYMLTAKFVSSAPHTALGKVVRFRDVMRCIFFLKKVDDLLVVASKDGLKLLNEPVPPPNLNRPAKYVLKLTLAPPGGAHAMRGCTYKFSL